MGLRRLIYAKGSDIGKNSAYKQTVGLIKKNNP